jgi:hypothetical protein
MDNLITRSRLLALAALLLLGLAMVRPAYAGSPVAIVAGGPVVSPTSPFATVHATGMVGAGTRALGVATNAATLRRRAIVKPIITPIAILGVQHPHVGAPGLYDLQVTASAVTVKWYDTSDNELGFKVFRRDTSGGWQLVYQIATRNMAGAGSGDEYGGTDYSWVDTSTNVSGQCYMIAAYNASATGYTTEQCTVRPDPSRFPPYVGRAAVQWSGLSNINDGTGNLVNTNLEQHLLSGNQTWGVDLTGGDSSLWRVEAQGGPHLMKGQAVALKVWGGGWLKYGNQSFGVDLQLSSTPVYEWYAIGAQGNADENPDAGLSLTDAGTFALWNSSAQAYLVHGYETWGVSLKWYKVGGGSSATPTPIPTHGVKTERVLNCSIDQQAVEVFIADQTVGGSFVDEGRIDQQYGSAGCPDSGSVPLTFSPLSGHHYLLVATDSTLLACDGVDDPSQDACRKMMVEFDGDANGYTRTDIVDDVTQITP